MPNNKKNIAVFYKDALKEFSYIHKLSKKYNSLSNKNHAKKIISLIRKHIKEIDTLYNKKNKHYIIETGDLLVLCMEIFLETGKNPDKIINICFKRYKNKLSQLLNEAQKKGCLQYMEGGKQ